MTEFQHNPNAKLLTTYLLRHVKTHTSRHSEARRAMSFEIVPVEDNQHQGRNSDRELVPRTLTTHLGRLV